MRYYPVRLWKQVQILFLFAITLQFFFSLNMINASYKHHHKKLNFTYQRLQMYFQPLDMVLNTAIPAHENRNWVLLG